MAEVAFYRRQADGSVVMLPRSLLTMSLPQLLTSTASSVEDRVFPAHPRLDRYFASRAAEAARRRLTQCLVRGDGPALLLGAAGLGKTMLMNVLASDLADRLRVVRLASTQLCTRRALLQAILHGLGADFRDREEGELRLSLGDLLMDPAATGEGVALLIDEAQTLPVRLLEELRLLSNAAVEGVPRLRLVLAGSGSLDEVFTAPELETFSQRIAARCYLEPLSRAETAQYVRAHLAAAGGDPDRLLTADAYEALALASDGLPRLINQVADRALVLAVEAGKSVLDGQAISEAWSDLHQLAAPWQTPSTAPLAARASSTECAEPDGPAIEFGMLDEEDALQAEAEAVTRLEHEELGNSTTAPSTGVWDAGDKLHDLPIASGASDSFPRDDDNTGSDPTDDDDDDTPVSLAFPRVASADEALAPKTLAEGLTDEALYAEVERVLGHAVDSASDPFAESYDEEEVVLDPYSERERVIPAAPQVANTTLTDLERAYSTLESIEAADNAVLDLEAEPEDGTELEDPAETEAEVQAQLAEVAAAVNEAVVIVEPDEVTLPAPTVRRQDYADLFANLRQG